MKKFLEERIESQKKLYEVDHLRMVSDYNGEKGLSKVYNGRQLFELIQNADDANADRILIELSEVNNTLTIANTGNAFSKEGFSSLMLANLSSKTKEQYIGNKGLGFRSVINWSDRIVITGNGLDVEFSEAIAKSVFEELFSEEKRGEILKNRNLSPDAVPAAFLAIPKIRVNKTNDWATQITLSYKPEFLDDIRKQLSSLQESNTEILLFLNHISEVKIKTSDSENLISRTIIGNKITIEGKEWEVHESSGLLPDNVKDEAKREKEHYNLKIATTEDFSSGPGKLFTFFPTKVDIDFPMVIHGTFDLNSSRNQLNDSEKNKYILGKLIELIVSTAQKISGSEVSWKPLKLLMYSKENRDLDDLDFYEGIDNATKNLEIFPCIDNKYRKLSEVAYLDDAFSTLLIETDNCDIFPNHLKPSPEINLYISRFSISNQIESFEEKVNQLSKKLLSQNIEYRVNLITILQKMNKEDYKYNLLLNDRGELIQSDNDVYTPTLSAGEMALPSFVKIDFLQKELFDRLIIAFDIKLKEKSRELQRKLKSITNIQSYEPAQVLTKIITATNKIIKNDPINSNFHISEMVEALYANYKVSSKTRIPTDTKIQLLAKDGTIVDAKNLHLSKGYPTGVLTELLFGKLYDPNQFLADPVDFGSNFESENKDELESFFIWLGVNIFVKYLTVSEKTNVSDKASDSIFMIRNGKPYIAFVYKKINQEKSAHKVELKCLAIDEGNLDKIFKSFTKEQLVMWLLSDPKINNRLDLDNEDEFKFSMPYDRVPFNQRLREKPSYVFYQLIKRKVFEEYLITDDASNNLINPFRFNYKDELFKQKGIPKPDIDSILLKLGAKEKFEDLPFPRVQSILKELPHKDPSGSQTQKIYKLVLDHYKKNKTPLGKGIKLFAKKDGTLGYFDQDEIYYSDAIKIHQKIMRGKALLNFPARSGARQVVNCFSINSLDGINISIPSYQGLSEVSLDFDNYFKDLKPYILTYRIAKMQQGKNEEASKLNKLSILLCSEVKCSIDGESYILEEYDYVQDGHRFLINIGNNRELDRLKSSSIFCDTFAEIITSAFQVNEHLEHFRNILKNSFDDTEHTIKNLIGHNVLADARKLLDISGACASFWNAIYSTQKKTCPPNINKDSFLKVQNDLEIQNIPIENINYECLTEPSSVAIIKDLFLKLNVDVPEFNSHAFHTLDLTAYHKNNIEDAFHSFSNKFIFSLWTSLNGAGIEEQKKFLNKISDYDKNFDWVESKLGSIKFELSIDYGKLVDEFLSSSFPNLKICESGDFDFFYLQNKEHINADDLDSLDIKLESLLYFEGGLGIVKSFLQSPIKTSSTDNPKEDHIPTKKIPESSFDTIPFSPETNSNVNKGPWKHSPKVDGLKKERGMSAERIVFNALVEKYTKQYVEHSSERDDSLGYDIKYSSDDGVSWNYVEVKRYSNNCFYMSKNEMLFAKKHKGKYEIYLVDSDDEIIPLNKDLDLSDELQFRIEENQYIVRFSIQYPKI